MRTCCIVRYKNTRTKFSGKKYVKKIWNTLFLNNVMLLNFKLNLILKNYISIIKMQSKFSVGKIVKKNVIYDICKQKSNIINFIET